MPSMPRRARGLLLLVGLAVLTILYLTSSARRNSQSEFYERTSAALQNQGQKVAEGVRAADAEVLRRLGEAKDAVMGAKGGAAKKAVEEKSDDPHVQARQEMDRILKKAPIIIFSKSYCPYSKKGKAVMAMYNITPAPYIVELDQHQLGGALQDVLLDTTGRRSVPNIMIKGQSIGGGDDVAALHDQGVLADLIRNKAGKSVTQVTLKQG